MIVSIEIPVFKGGWLIPCIESVLGQTSPDWNLSLLWDGGDALSRKILDKLAALNHPRIRVHFAENRGIARARAFLTANSTGEWILPVDDDDVLDPNAVALFLNAAAARPWSSIIRARRSFIDEEGQTLDMPDWFPFERRLFEHGMVTDLMNHAHPYLIRRSAYERTSGWEGFEDFFFAGEDCDIFVKLEEVAPVELLDAVLYCYRLNPSRASHDLGPPAALEMWRRIADRTIARLGLSIERITDVPPFRYDRIAAANPPALEDVDFVIPHYVSDDEELPYAFRRPTPGAEVSSVALSGRMRYRQPLPDGSEALNRIDLAFQCEEGVSGEVAASIVDASDTQVARATAPVAHEAKGVRFLRLEIEWTNPVSGELAIELTFRPGKRSRGELSIATTPSGPSGQKLAFLRLYRRAAGRSTQQLERCLESLRRAGVSDDAIHVVAEQQSSARNRNTGFAHTTRPFVCFLDDDVEVHPGSVEELLAVMASEEADLAAPRVVYPNGTIYCAEPYFDVNRYPVPRGLGEPDDGRYRGISPAPWLPTTMMIIRREVAVAVRGFDEDFVGSQMEDIDFCLKARQRDFRCVYAGSTAVTHFNHQRNDRFDENFRHLLHKWHNRDDLFGLARRRAEDGLRMYREAWSSTFESIVRTDQ
ncbi:MAG TPA: glycosyltransferase [Thermoanaerobaculia bacterium]|jgi:GT2 family glycosyltransferase|nr:glycosyltransferase [Thermoanaerobaculia bacterium]